MKIKKEHRVFVSAYVQLGQVGAAYKKAYPNVSAATARVNGSRLLKNSDIADAIYQHQEKVRGLATSAAVKELKDQIVYEVLSSEKKKDILRQIAEGTTVNKEVVPIWDEKTQTWKSKVVKITPPTFADRIKAIEIHNRMVGDFAPDKLDHTTKGSKIGGPVDFEAMPVEILETLAGYINTKIDTE